MGCRSEVPGSIPLAIKLPKGIGAHVRLVRRAVPPTTILLARLPSNYKLSLSLATDVCGFAFYSYVLGRAVVARPCGGSWCPAE